MELKNYFDFLSDDDIRIKGTRIGIETIMEDYLDGVSPEEIAVRYRSLTLEQVYASITYFLRNREEVEVYLSRRRHQSDQAGRLQDRHPPEIIKRLRRIKAANAGIQGSPAA